MKSNADSQSFSSFGFSPVILAAIKRADYSAPTDVQQKAIPSIMEGRDVLAGAETGSGKTAAFALPIIEKLIHQKREEGEHAARGNHVRALVLVPTRELAIQISDEFTAYSQDVFPKIKALSVFGGVKINPQMMALRGGADVLVATPGRLLDLASQNAVKFNKLKTLVLDEVDRLVGDGFKDEIEDVFRLLPNHRQNLMFTATFPESIRYLIRRLLTQPVIINVDPSDEILIDQRVFTVNREKKNDLLAHLLNEYDWKQILVFCSAKKSCDNLVKKLEKRGITAVAMHGNKEQRARTKALREFREGKTRVLIATDVAARGLDIEQLPCIINFELPRSPNDYIHRIGRTGRAGETGFAISLIAHHEYAHFSVIEKRNGLELAREQIEGMEADAVAPEPIARAKPKKKAKAKLSKKKRQRLLDKKSKAKQEDSLTPLKPSLDKDEKEMFKPVVPKRMEKAKASSASYQKAPRKPLSAKPKSLKRSQFGSEPYAWQSDKKPAEEEQKSKSQKPWQSDKKPKSAEQKTVKKSKPQQTKKTYNNVEKDVPKKQKKQAEFKPQKKEKKVASSDNSGIWGSALKRKRDES